MGQIKGKEQTARSALFCVADIDEAWREQASLWEGGFDGVNDVRRPVLCLRYAAYFSCLAITNFAYRLYKTK